MSRRHPQFVVPLAVVLMALGVLISMVPVTIAPAAHQGPLVGIHKIKHVIIIMQENRSFDNYFGTFPGADGLPTTPVCNPLADGTCLYPRVDHANAQAGGPHNIQAAVKDVNAGAMNGFGTAQQDGEHAHCNGLEDPECLTALGNTDAVSYHTASDIPNYWAYAKRYTLQDHMFEPIPAWSLPAHLKLVSGWSASCTSPSPMSCATDLQTPINTKIGASFEHTKKTYAWTDLTYLLHRHHVSWGYYVQSGNEPDCADAGQMTCTPKKQNSATPGIWNPLPGFTDVKADGELKNIQPLNNYFRAARTGQLPAVSWLTPASLNSEHPGGLLSNGMAYTTAIVNAAMKSPDWSSTAIFVTWDDWGGFYDHVTPPVLNGAPTGLRVPGLVISPYAKPHYIDHQTYTFDSYLKFIEDDFLAGTRLNPATDGRPDARPVTFETITGLGDLRNSFDFSSAPRGPLVLNPHPKTTLR